MWTCALCCAIRTGSTDLPLSSSPKITAPSKAVTTKFALVLMTLTRTVLVESVKALVNSVHMTPLNARFIVRKIYVSGVSACQIKQI